MKKFNSNFYAENYTRYYRLYELDDEDYVRANLHSVEANGYTEDDIMRELPEFERFFSNTWEGRVKKKNISIAKSKAAALKLYLDVNTVCMKTVSLPNGYLFSGWGTGRRTKITPSDLPESYVKVTNYHKPGYLKASGVKDLVYKESPFHNHTFKDDFLYISYHRRITHIGHEYEGADEYIFGHDIINVIEAIEKYSPEFPPAKIKNIKERMVIQYNAFVEECGSHLGMKKISTLDDLRGEWLS